MHCTRSECQTTSGCAHRGPRGELCWFGTWGDPRDARIAELEAALRPFADAYRMAKTLGVPDSDDISFRVPELESAAKLVQSEGST